MKGLLVFALLFVACKGSKDPQSTSDNCGELGGPCSREGATCSPAPIGSGWSHMLSCHDGKWSEMEIAPLPTPAGDR